MTALRAKKSLGQHFLTSSAIAEGIARALPRAKGNIVVEIGPGEGILTEALLATGAVVLAVEKDRRALPILRERFAHALDEERLVLVEGDILEFEPERAGLREGSYALVGNIPYYVTGAVLRKFTDERSPPSSLVLMVQLEVAERMIGRSEERRVGKECRL